MRLSALPRSRAFAVAPWLIATALLIAPAVAMRYTREVAWTASDFAFAAVLLYAPCALFEVARRQSSNIYYLAGSALGLLAGLMLLWACAAVGVVGNEHDDANVLFAGVVAMGITGALLARLRPRGMAVAMLATAGAQVAAAAVGSWLTGDVRGAAVSLAFAAMWMASAALFRRAG